MATSTKFEFDRQILDCVLGGVSALDIPRVNVQSNEEAKQFIASYGYDIEKKEHADELWLAHRRAVHLIETELLEPEERIPKTLSDPAKLGELTHLLLAASGQGPVGGAHQMGIQRWACAILRVMHVYVHLRNDLFSAFRDEIQAQILKGLQDAIVLDDMDGCSILGPHHPGGGIRLHKFEIKPFKTTSSSVIKLLARPEKVALTLLDKLGVRIVTRSLFDSFRAVRFLFESHLLSFPHIIPDQSNNTLYPVNLFIEVMQELKTREARGLDCSDEFVAKLLQERLETAPERAQYLEKTNEFSGPEYRFIKFINRKLITVTVGAEENKRAFRFFYPYEIQVMDDETYSRNLSGAMAHNEYKERQKRRARRRVFGLDRNAP